MSRVPFISDTPFSNTLIVALVQRPFCESQTETIGAWETLHEQRNLHVAIFTFP